MRFYMKITNSTKDFSDKNVFFGGSICVCKYHTTFYMEAFRIASNHTLYLVFERDRSSFNLLFCHFDRHAAAPMPKTSNNLNTF